MDGIEPRREGGGGGPGSGGGPGVSGLGLRVGGFGGSDQNGILYAPLGPFFEGWDASERVQHFLWGGTGGGGGIVHVKLNV